LKASAGYTEPTKPNKVQNVTRIMFREFLPNKKENKQCTRNLTLRNVHETAVAVEKQCVVHVSVCEHGWVGHGRRLVLSCV
jgi:hypothetical protein